MKRKRRDSLFKIPPIAIHATATPVPIKSAGFQKKLQSQKKIYPPRPPATCAPDLTVYTENVTSLFASPFRRTLGGIWGVYKIQLTRGNRKPPPYEELERNRQLCHKLRSQFYTTHLSPSRDWTRSLCRTDGRRSPVTLSRSERCSKSDRSISTSDLRLKSAPE